MVVCTMILNLITPLFRSGHLTKIKASIPAHGDVNWIIVLCEEREILKRECDQLGLSYLTIPESEGPGSVHLKTNKALENLLPGFFQGLDDDTVFNPTCYDVFKQHGSNYKMIIGAQRLQEGKIRPGQIPVPCYTDGGQGLIHTDLLKSIRIGNFKTDPTADCTFLLDCYKAAGSEVLITQEVISNYNFLR